MSKADFDGLSPGAKKGFEGMNKDLKENRFREESNLNVGDQVLATTADRASVLLKQFEEAQKALRDLAGQGYGLDENAPIVAGLNKAISLTDTFLQNAKYGREAMERLANSTPTNQFQTLSSVLSDSTGELATNAATLNQLGLSYSQFSKNVDMMIYSFNQSESGVKSINQQLFNFAKEVKQLPSVVSSNFQLVAQSLGYAFPQIQNEFVKIQKLSAQTGVSVQKLMGTFGQQTDTIAGASSFAASMNSLLGKNVFSATQVLMMDESERMTATRDELRKSQVYKDYMSDDPKLKKFALRAMSSRLQMSPDETRRFLDETRPGGEAAGSLKGQMAKNIDDNFNESAGALTRSIGTLTQAIAGNANLIDFRRRTAANRDLAQMRRGTLMSLTDPRGNFALGQDMRTENINQFVAQYGTQLKDFSGKSTQEYATAILNAYQDGRQYSNAVAQKLDQAYRMVSAEPLLDGPFNNMGIVKKIEDGDFEAANTALDDFLKNARSESTIPKQDDRISKIEANVLKQFKDKPEQMRVMMRKYRLNKKGQEPDADKIKNALKEEDATLRKKALEEAGVDTLGSVRPPGADFGLDGRAVNLTIVASNGAVLVDGLTGRFAERLMDGVVS